MTVQSPAGVAIIRDTAILRITGSDATRWLNGMVTNSVQALQPGEGNYNFLLNAQGRIQGDCTIYREGGESPTFLLHTTEDQVDTIHQLLDKFIIMDDVELTRTPAIDEQSLLFLGSAVDRLLPQLGLPPVPPAHYALAQLDGAEIALFTSASPTRLSYEMCSSSDVIARFHDAALQLGATALSTDDLEALRILAGVPRFSLDIRDRDLPQETNQAHALHFAKGCYLGQEIVERIRSRGQVHRLFTAFTLQGAMPTLPAPLELNGKPAGELTSAAEIGDQIYALGYGRREALEGKLPLTYDRGTASPRTIPTLRSIQQHEN